MGFSFILKRTNKGHPSTIKATNLEMFLTNISAFHSIQPTIITKNNADDALRVLSFDRDVPILGTFFLDQAQICSNFCNREGPAAKSSTLERELKIQFTRC